VIERARQILRNLRAAADEQGRPALAGGAGDPGGSASSGRRAAGVAAIRPVLEALRAIDPERDSAGCAGALSRLQAPREEAP
jgi:hypothetical protein